VLLEVAGRSLDDRAFDGAPGTLADELLRPSIIYAPAIHDLIRAVEVKAVAHITGGGITGNLSRVLDSHVDAEVDLSTWEPPRIFGEIQTIGDIDDDEMAKVFNLGMGMVVAIPRDDVFHALDVLRAAGHRATEIGTITAGHGHVHLSHP
jgi:phosphoribosylformylglycinamidine cyclo-ligase